MSKSDKYASSKSDETMDSLSARLASDLRTNVRQIGYYDLFTPQWLAMVDSYSRIANISEMEYNLPSNKSGGTLWETEEQALRFLMEDGKLSISLRNMIRFKTHQMNLRNESKDAETNQETIEKSSKFEKSLGIILKNVWKHAEGVATTDLVLLSNYMNDILDSIILHPTTLTHTSTDNDITNNQEILMFNYMQSILTNIDNITETKMMPTIRANNTFMKVIQVVNLSSTSTIIATVDKLKMAQAASLLCDTEDFKTYVNEYIKDINDAELLFTVKNNVLASYVSDFDTKKTIRSLLDLIDKMKRMYKLK